MPDLKAEADLKDQVVERLRRVKGPDLDGNIVDLGLVSDVLIKSTLR